MTKTLDTLTDRERRLCEVSIHEAAHSIVGVVLGGRLKLATVVGDLEAGAPDITGKTVFDDLPTGQDAAVAYAGPWAAARWTHDRRPTQRDVFAVLRAGGCEDDKVLLASGATAVTAGRVTPLIERCWKPIMRLAGKIAADTTARHSDVLSALGLSSHPQTAALELAHIRAGAVPGSFRVTRPVVAV